MNSYTITSNKFTNLIFNDEFLNPQNVSNCILRDDFPGFKEDYITIHLLIKKYKPFNIIEIGTNSGIGTNIICNAMSGNPVFSIDLPKEYDMSIIYNAKNPEDGRPKNVGECCKLPYTQLWGNSKDFDFSKYYPIDAWFIDGKHNYEYVINDTNIAMNANSRLIMWHDVQISEVEKGIIDSINLDIYNLFYVQNTRIAFAVKK